MLGDNAVGAYHIGDLLAARAYVGDELVWESAPVVFTVEQE